MQSLQSSQSNFIQNTMSKVEEYFVEIDLQLDSSFTRIDQLVDQIVYKSFEGMNHQNESLLELPQFIQFQIDFTDYQQQIIECVKPLVNKFLKNEIKIKNRKIIENDSQSGEIEEFDRIQNEGKLEVIIQSQKEMILVGNKQKQLEQQLMKYKQVQFNLIDDSNQQIGWCYAIVFNKDGSIMISCDNCGIKIWNFEQGRFKLSNSYNKHTNPVKCLVFSKKTNNFISGCGYNQIICWQQINQKDWKYSQLFEQHTDSVNCLLLNQQEDQLISGGMDNKLIVWKVDFIKNHLTFLYSLDQNINSINSLSFNQSETLLASCDYSHFIIWEKGQQGNVESGYKIHFINDQQFLWVTSKMNDILVFELQNRVFKQNQNKTISLIKNNECEDDRSFPIMHNKDRNVIFVRHKNHIYLIRQLNDGTLSILASLNSQSRQTYGTITNNAQYLVFQDMKSQKYSSYEIQYI
ncbi:unnamed protein product [Paramecium octaurelia]|uniref:WD40-repeat-containing domain n=1 Tax=Paramecium octaurelia TaxID=43137 RepID=A0A8S1YK42_PAROT|nr:unnamed protein product [Paramecium octaurelia]